MNNRRHLNDLSFLVCKMGMILFWVLCGVDAKTEKFSMGQKWLGSSTSTVVSHWLAAWGESGLRVNAVVDLKGGSRRL